jgi:hypothetical protein
MTSLHDILGHMAWAGNVVFVTLVGTTNKHALAELRPKLQFRSLIKLTLHPDYFYQSGN